MISLDEIRNRSIKFALDWEGETYERGESQTFWNEFFEIFEIPRRRVATFEEPVKKLGGSQGFIDLFWKGQLLIEHKSFGKNLEKAKTQAFEYFPNIPNRDLPRYVLVCDFASFELYDLDESKEYYFKLSELYKNIELFTFIVGYPKKTFKEQEPINSNAALLMGRLHDNLRENGYEGHELELYLTRILFCLFAQDTGIFSKSLFREFIDENTSNDAKNLGAQISHLFQVLDTPFEKRQKNLDEFFTHFPYINGSMFRENIRIANLDQAMREMLLDACVFNWSLIDPSIFGSMFQATLDIQKRSKLGAYYTSEINILKVIKPLFLDALWEEFESIKSNSYQLQAFHKKLSELCFLDSACGSGNFLVVSFRELKKLEFAIMEITKTSPPLVQIEQFYGFEIEELPVRIAETAMLLVAHQMNLKYAEKFGEFFFNIPIKKSAKIFHVNALRADWNVLLEGVKIDYIMGNPPFLGSKKQSKEQKIDIKTVFHNAKNVGILDYVSAWFVKAAEYVQDKPTKVAFVATDSISKGEQVGPLWRELYNIYGIKINFAHQTFKWRNEAKNNAAVHCVIIGFSKENISQKKLFEYETPKSKPSEKIVSNINPYLKEGKDYYVMTRKKPFDGLPKMGVGNKPIDGGLYLFTDEKKAEFIKNEPNSEPLFKQIMGADEFLYSINRWCLWLGDCLPQTLKKMPQVLKLVNEVKKYREKSTSKPTIKLAETPTRFHIENMPKTRYLAIPETSTETRKYIPIGFMNPDILCTSLMRILPNATLYHFGILTSLIHNDWMRYVGGRLEGRYRYSIDVVYNNFPFPQNVTESQKNKIEKLALTVLEVRSEYNNSTLADLYDSLTMPTELLKAHIALDKAVDKLYSKNGFKSEEERVTHLFSLHEKLTKAEIL